MDDRYVAGIMCVRTGEYKLNRYLGGDLCGQLASGNLDRTLEECVSWSSDYARNHGGHWEPFVVHVTDAERLK